MHQRHAEALDRPYREEKAREGILAVNTGDSAGGSYEGHYYQRYEGNHEAGGDGPFAADLVRDAAGDAKTDDRRKAADNREEHGGAGDGIQIIDESNKVTDQICVTQDKKQELYTGKEIIKKELQGEWVLVTAGGALYDAKIFKELRFPCGRHYEDEYVFVSVFENQECVVCIPENIYFYLQRADSIMGVTYKKQDCMDYFEMWHERIDYFQAKEDRELLAPVIQSCLAWNVLYLAMNGEAMEEPEKRLLKKDIRKYFWKIFAKPYLYNWKESVKLAVKCVMVLMNDKSLGKRYV